ncbi:hypothetical protein BDF21DRAFT_440923 [Thamnidium elegans]|nr:hypothetical protein BDF21DRAFT_440923 [Thamnidium elegans]
MTSTLTTALMYIKDLLNGTKRNINANNPHFLSRIGLSDGSQALLETIGFHMEDNYFIAPDIELGSFTEQRLKKIQKEIILVLETLRLELGSASVPYTAAEANMKVKTANMQELLGIIPSLENRYTSNSEYIVRAYASFGLTSGASDSLVAWTYNKLISETTMDPYDAMDALVTISNQSNSDVLRTLVACERSKGKIGWSEIGDAYAYFGITEDAADDRLLIGLYQVKLSDEPEEKTLHQDKLKIIAIARASSELIEFLKEEKGIASSSSNQSVEDMMGVPAHMVNSAQNTPVGLNNIGNTCYFNSVLQYYFTILPFRSAMIHNEQYVEDGFSEPKKIGGIEVDRSEVIRAKKFVELLKGLFIKLQETNEKAISPEYDLAYMALLNEKDDDTAAAEIIGEKVSASSSVQNVPLSFLEEETIEKDLISMDDETPIDTEMTETDTTDSDPIPIPKSSTTDEDKDLFDALNTELQTKGTNSSSSSIKMENEEVEFEFRRTSFTNEIAPPNSPPPSYHDIVPTTSEKMHFEEDIKEHIAEAPKAKERPSVDTMMFECMGNVMYLVEAALKPLKTTEDGEQIDDMIRQVFYGKARQILSYYDNTTSKMIKKEMEEDFSHVIIDASEGKDLYDGLDEYFFADKVEEFQGGYEATREVTVKSFPPVLQILVQRVQFDRATANVYKSNAFIQFDKVIYLDRYVEDNFEQLRDRRTEVANWRTELEKSKKEVDKYKQFKNLNFPVPDLLEAARQVLSQVAIDETEEFRNKKQIALQVLAKEAEEKRQIIQSNIEKMQEFRSKIKDQYSDYKKLAYKLHAVFIHQGQANYGHYWIYILDHDENQWWKYNDSMVSKVNESEVYHDTTGSTANPYFLVYVDQNRVNEYVETIVKR